MHKRERLAQGASPAIATLVIHGQELNATVPDPDRTPLILDLGRI